MTDWLIVGKMFTFTSRMAEDREQMMDLINELVHVDTKKEAVVLVRRIRGLADTMEREIKKAGTDYMLKEVD